MNHDAPRKGGTKAPGMEEDMSGGRKEHGAPEVNTETFEQLRSLAEAALEKESAQAPQRPRNESLERLVHELDVHSVELALQHEELVIARDEAESSRARFQSLFDGAPVGYLTLTPRGEINRANREAARLLASGNVPLPSRSLLRYIDLEDVAGVAEVLQRAVASRKPVQVQARLHRPRGEALSVLMHFEIGDMLFSDDPVVFATLTDVTSLERVRRDLEASRSQYRTLVENLPVIVTRYDRDGRILYINSAVETSLGISPEDCIGRQVTDAFPSEGRNILENALQRAFATGQEETISLGWPHLGALRHFKVVVAPEFRNGEVSTVLTIASDVTEETRLQRSLKAAMKRAEQADRAKSAFLANMSHEIRTPFSAIMNICEMLLKKEQDENKAEWLRMMRDSGMSLLTVLNDILDLSRLEAGRFDLHPRPFSPREMFRQVGVLFSPKAAQKGIELLVSTPPDIPERLFGDTDRIAQVLRNLVDNALKFTERGSVRLEMSGAPNESGEWLLTFAVLDTGPGVPPEFKERIFQDFFQVNSTSVREKGGTGLGLSISARLVALMGGRLDVESAEGRGSRFFFTLPLSIPLEDNTSEPAGSGGKTPRRILLVEDNAVNQLVLKEILTEEGHDVLSAYNGEQALEMLERESCDVVLMDVHMTGMDGMEATRCIRSSGKSYADVPIIAFTAYAHESEQARFYAAGMDACVAKPVESEDLEEAVEAVLARREREGRERK